MNIGDRLIDPMKGPVTVVDVREDVELKVDATGEILIRSPHWVQCFKKLETHRVDDVCYTLAKVSFIITGAIVTSVVLYLC